MRGGISLLTSVVLVLRLDDRSRMTRECHVRICGGLGGKFPGATRQRCCWWVQFRGVPGRSKAPASDSATAERCASPWPTAFAHWSGNQAPPPAAASAQRPTGSAGSVFSLVPVLEQLVLQAQQLGCELGVGAGAVGDGCGASHQGGAPPPHPSPRSAAGQARIQDVPAGRRVHGLSPCVALAAFGPKGFRAAVARAIPGRRPLLRRILAARRSYASRVLFALAGLQAANRAAFKGSAGQKPDGSRPGH